MLRMVTLMANGAKVITIGAPKKTRKALRFVGRINVTALKSGHVTARDNECCRAITVALAVFNWGAHGDGHTVRALMNRRKHGNMAREETGAQA